jgi:hypothetical protein
MAIAVAADHNEEIVRYTAQCRFDPLRWAKLAWDWGHGDLAGVSGPRPWQSDILGVIRDHLANPATRYQPCRIAVASGHGIGKSALMGMISNWAMSCFTDCKGVATANTDTQLRTKTSPEVGKWFRMALTAHWFDTQSQAVKVREPGRENAWRLDFVPWSEHNTEAFAGLHNKGKIVVLLFDEASKIADKVWEVAEGALTDEGTIIIWIVFGNPTRNMGRFRECFRKFRHRWVTRQIDSRDVEGSNKQYLQQQIDDYGIDSDVVKVRVLGQFPSSGTNQFISTADVDEARGRHLRPEQYSFAPRIIGVDPAWTGEDEFVIYFRQGLYSKKLAVFARNDNDIAMAQVILRFEQEMEADAVFIDAGHGTGIYSAGQTWGRPWQLVWFAEKSADQACINKRVEMWKSMRDWLKTGGTIDPADDVLYYDLIGPELVPRLDGKLQLESKEDMKDRGIPSPNRADALALTFAHPVVRREYAVPGQSGRRVDVDRVPY